MAVVAADMKIYLSGGASNAVPAASLGGAISATEVPTGAQNLFDNVGAGEASAGDVEYRCFFLKNTNGTDAINGVKLWIETQTPSPSTEVAVGLDPAGKNASAATPANEDTAPAGVAFTTPANEGAGLAVGNLAAGDRYAVWVRRTVTAGAAALGADDFALRISGTPA